jgi:hypothetical protein
MEDIDKIALSIQCASRMKYIKDEKKKKIAEFLFDYAYPDEERDCVSVPLFRVLDALAQDGEPYSEG